MNSDIYRLRLKGLRLSGHVGVAPHELDAPQEIVVDIRLDVDRSRQMSDSALSAGIPETPPDVVCYDALAQLVRTTVQSRRWPLVEDLASHLAQRCLADSRVHRVRVSVRKPAAIADADWAGAEITAHRRPSA